MLQKAFTNQMPVKRALLSLLSRIGFMSVLEHFDAKQPNLLRILAYHRVDEVERWPQTLDPGLLSVTPAMFAWQMRYLAEHYHVFSCQELVAALAEGKEIPPRSVMVTFDDGYKDFRENAWPILKKWQIPAILFVPTAYPGAEDMLFWWDRLHQGLSRTSKRELHISDLGGFTLGNAAERRATLAYWKSHLIHLEHHKAMALVDQILETLEVVPARDGTLLTWDEIRDLAGEGVTVAAHTRSHPILTRLSVEEARQEIIDAQQDLRREIGEVCPVFCYPNGLPGTFNEPVIAILRAEGFVAAFTLVEGINVLEKTDPLCLKRIGIGRHVSAAGFRWRLTRAYTGYWDLRQHVRLTSPETVSKWATYTGYWDLRQHVRAV